MKAILPIALSLLGWTVEVTQARSLVHGQVWEYNGTVKRHPLAGVEIQAIGAGSTVSDKQGRFTLDFRVLQPGDPIRFRSIYKSGYHLLNQESVEAMVIPNDTSYLLVLVLTSDKKQEQIRQSYYMAASKHFQTMAARLEKTYHSQLKQGIINAEQYERKVQEVQADFERRLDSAEKFIRRFAQVDISQIGSSEQHILKLFKSGKIDEALAAYDRQNLVQKIVDQQRNIEREQGAQQMVRDELTKHRAERDSMFNMLQRQTHLLRMVGGDANFAKAMSLLRNIAYADTTYTRAMLEYAYMAYWQKEFSESYKAYAIAGRHAAELPEQLQAAVSMGAAMRMMKQSEEARQLLLTTLERVDSLPGNHFIKADGYYHLGQISRFLHEIEKGKEYFTKCYEHYLLVYKQDSLTPKNISNVGRALIYRGYFEKKLGNANEAVRLHKEAIRYIQKAYHHRPRQYAALLAYAYHYLAYDFDCNDPAQYADAMHWYRTSEQLFIETLDYNPEVYLPYLGALYASMGVGCMEGGQYQQALEYLLNSNKCYGRHLTYRPDQPISVRAMNRNNDSIEVVRKYLKLEGAAPLVVEPLNNSTGTR